MIRMLHPLSDFGRIPQIDGQARTEAALDRVPAKWNC
jgi:hypothetical protein